MKRNKIVSALLVITLVSLAGCAHRIPAGAILAYQGTYNEAKSLESDSDIVTDDSVTTKLQSHVHDAEDSDEAKVALYKPNYVTMNPEDRDLKFQLSYRIRLYKFSKSLNLFLSQTHKAYWAITTEKSAPFREHNFNPELFLRWKTPENYLYLKYVQFGFEHESTGVAGSLSRGWNRLTGQAEWTFNSNDHTKPGHIHAYVRGWVILDRDTVNNKDIGDHLGLGEIFISYTLHELPNFPIPIPAQSEVAITKRLHSIMFEFGFNVPGPDFLGYIQYWTGRGEWLVGYNEDTKIFRAGLKFLIH